MNTTKTSFQKVLGLLTEWDANGSLPALKWTDDRGNNWRVIGSYQFDNSEEVYVIVVTKQLQLAGTEEWISYSQYTIGARNTELRVLATGQIIKGGYRGNYDASTNLFPEIGGSGTAGAILKGDNWTIEIAGVLNGVPVNPGDIIVATSDAPAQDGGKWAFAIPQALDNKGNIINPNGWLGSGKFFTIILGYNPTGQVLSINSFVYAEMAEEEGLTII